MATARLTIGALLNTVGTAANTATATMDAVSSSVGMLNSYVTKAAKEQEIRHKADLSTFSKSLVREKAQEEALANLDVVEFCSKSADHATFYKSAYDEFAALLLEPVKNDTKTGLRVASGD